MDLTRKRKKDLGLAELIAIGLGGMVGGGIFSILGISVAHIGHATPLAITAGGILAFFAAYSYVKLALLYKDEGATYSFFRKSFPNSAFSASVIGWLVVFGYISTLALYAFTFSSYLCSILPVDGNGWAGKAVAGGVIGLFAMINLVSVKGMGKAEDLLVYSKLIILIFISGILAGRGQVSNLQPLIEPGTHIGSILVMASITFVAYEGFQLIIHAYNEMDEPQRNIPRAIYSAIAIATLLYVGIALGALATIPKEVIIRDQEYALASGASAVLGKFGLFAVILGALLATSSAISGTLFGASRLMAVIANDGYFPSVLKKRSKGTIPAPAIVTMSVLSFVLMLSGGLETILEFGSITFILVSFLMAVANFKMRRQTHAQPWMAVAAMAGLLGAAILIVRYEFDEQPGQMLRILMLYGILALLAWLYARWKKRSEI
ncbi:MAG: amino acid permease [Flavobacteriales bacterium]|nr:amino acid permease [Flavobacteriales bacterium]MCB9447041.1 amino acid permease [Flavobacteriales bacterium]